MKRITAVLIAALMLFSLAACTGANQAAPTAAPGGNISETSPQGTAETDPAAAEPTFPPFDPEHEFDNRFAEQTLSICETEDAWYWCTGYLYYLYYYDKPSGETGPLCGRPECEHEEKYNNKDCNAYIGHCRDHMQLYEGKLWWVGPNNEKGDLPNIALWREDLDGTNREKMGMVTFPDNTHYNPQAYWIHRGRLYMNSMTPAVDVNSVSKSIKLFSTDLNCGDYKLIYERDFDAGGYSYMRFFRQYAYLFVEYCNYDTENLRSMEIVRYDSESDTAETIYDGCEFDAGFVWADIDDEGRVLMAFSGDEYNSVYRLEDGKFTEILGYTGEREGYHALRMYGDRVLAMRYTDTETWDNDVLFTDYEGNTIYEGKVPRDWVDEFEGNFRFSGFTFGRWIISDDTFAFLYHLSYPNDSRQRCDYVLVFFTVTDNGLEWTIIGSGTLRTAPPDISW
ncbi:MAG: hypothetical protein IK064_03890 [Clostridia bacterium]|nr:hypothetical protein [Clostridia bacterium]